MGVIKRAPEIPREVVGRYEAISKADWVEAFRDLYLQCFGETASADEWMADAERRREILRTYRQAG